MGRSTVKTELVCSELWGDELFTELPPMFHGDQIHLSFELPEYGKIDGLFEVEEILHFLNSKGYLQRLKISPVRG